MKRYFKGIARKLRAHMQDISSNVGHAGEQGASNERIVVEFLSAYLPRRYAVGRGKVVAHNEEESKQIDVIVYDPYRNSPLYTEDGFLIATIERE